MKKTLALLLALVMIFALAVPAMAADNGSITVNNAVNGQTYNIYRIFDLESYDSTSNAYSYKVNSAWNGFFAESTGALGYVDISTSGYVTWKENADAAAFAKLALTYAKNNNIAVVATKTAADGKAEFTALPLGYYLVDSSVGALCILSTTDPTATVNEKNSEPTLEKKVWNAKTNAWEEAISATRGETVRFQITVTVGAGAENYTIHDKMDSKLTFKEITSVKKGDAVISESNYVVRNAAACSDGCTFEIAFGENYCTTLSQGDIITVEYTAIFNGTSGEAKNTANLSYGDGSNTPDDDAKVKTYGFIIIKWNGKYEVSNDKMNDAILLTAQFKLTDANDNIIYFVQPEQEEIDACWGNKQDKGYETLRYNVWNESADGENNTKTYVITAGWTEISGLKEGTYYLEEIESPKGFNKIAEKMAIVIDANGTVTLDSKSASTAIEDSFVIENNTGAELPETGGIGTTIFYIVGGLLMVGAAVILVTRKKVSADK